MSSVSVFYTPSASAVPPSVSAAPTLAMNQSALGGAASFLDALFAALSGASGDTPLDPSATTAANGTGPDGKTVVSDETGADQQKDLSLNADALKALQSQLLLLAQHQTQTEQTAKDQASLDTLRTQILNLNADARDAASAALTQADVNNWITKAQELAAAQATDADMTPFTQLAAMQLSPPKVPALSASSSATESDIATIGGDEASALSSSDIAVRLNAIDVGGDKAGAGDKGDAGKNGMPRWLENILSGGAKGEIGYAQGAGANAAGYQAPHISTTDKVKAMMDTILGVFGITPDATKDALGAAFHLDSAAVTPDTVSGYAQNLTQGNHTAIQIPAHSSANLAQAVALQLQQMAGNRETRSLTIQINPPELGNMQVKMTYGRDRSVKADISVEKPDTLELLQKDSATLRDAMQQAGLQADAGSLSFSLAGQGTFSDLSSNSGSARPYAASNDNDDLVAEITIRSSEEWGVDPKTGITRYNIYV